MRRIFRPFAILSSVLLLTASCLGDDTNSDFVYYSDTAITAFSLGTLNQTVWTTTSDGTADSSYVDEIDGSDYAFYINQLTREIYNPDSLPKGTDAAHVLCNVSSKNSGTIIIKNTDSDTLRYYSSSDSIDFTVPREFRVYALDGSAYRAYTVKVNVHKEVPDSFNWHKMTANAAFTAMTAMKTVAMNSKLYVFGSNGTATSVYSRSTEGDSPWNELTPNIALDANAYDGVTVTNGMIYTLNGGSLVRSADGETWETICQPNLNHLLGAGRVKMYGIDADGDMAVSEDGGFTWAKDNLNGDAAMLPRGGASLGCIPLGTDASSEYVITVGGRDLTAYPDDDEAMVWYKVEEYSAGAKAHSWINCNEDNGSRLPLMAGLRTVVYDDALLAIGGEGIGESTATAFSKVYYSVDHGLSWQSDGKYYLPEGFDNAGSGVFGFTADEENFLWIVCGGTGDVWRGRLNRLGWTEEQTSFTE